MKDSSKESVAAGRHIPLLTSKNNFTFAEEVVLLPLWSYEKISIHKSNGKDDNSFVSYLAQACSSNSGEKCTAIAIFDDQGRLLDAQICENNKMQWLDRDVLIVLAEAWHIPTLPTVYRGRFDLAFIESLQSNAVVLPLHERTVESKRVIARTKF